MAVANQNARIQFQGGATDTTIVAASDPSATLVTGRTGYTIYVTHISLAVTTDNAATMTLQDSATTPIIIAKSKASPGIGPILWDFGDDGTPLTEAKSLALLASGAGLAGRLHIEYYFRQTNAIVA